MKPLVFSDLQVNQLVEGKVRNITDFGVFVRINNSQLTGLAHISECADDKINDLNAFFKKGDKVKALIIRLNEEKETISLTMKPSKLREVEEELEPEDVEMSSEEESEEEEGFTLISKKRLPPMEVEEEKEEELEPEDVEMSSEEEEEEKGKNIFELESGLSNAFEWNDFLPEVKEEEEEEEEQNKDVEMEEEKKKEKKKYKNEKEIAETEMLLANNNVIPESENDFERLLLGNPSSSHIYIRYASWLISITEINKARAVLKRGLETIPYRLEDEKLNIWYALLNLESQYGNEVQLEHVYKEAKEHMNDKLIRLHMVHIYENQEDQEKAISLWKEICKRYKEDVDCWLGYLNCCYMLLPKEKGSEKSSEVLKQAMMLVPSNSKVRLLSGYGVILYKYDSYDKGRTIFEDLLSKYPKKIDIWYIYIDQESKLNNLQYVRSLYTRLIEVKLNIVKIRNIFKRWISFEEEKGDEDHVAFVENKVQEYIQKLQE